MILLTGAAGRVGRATVSALLGADVPIRVLVRDANKLSSADAGVTHLVKVSSMEAAADARAVLPLNHYGTEQHIAASGMDWTFLRPNFYMQNLLMYAESIKRSGAFALPLGAALTAMIDTQDVGEVAAKVLLEEGHAGQIYELTGPDLMDFHEVARRLGAVTGADLRYHDQSPEDFRMTLGRFIASAWQLDAVCELFAEIAAGSLERRTDTVQELLGRAPTPLESFARRFCPFLVIAVPEANCSIADIAGSESG